jgi:flavin reductase ActVB
VKTAIDVFAEAMTHLASGVSIVTASDPDGSPQGLVVTSLCSYSVEPPSLLACLNCGGRSHDAVCSSAWFGVHLLGRDHDRIAARFASNGEDKFDGIDWRWNGEIPALDGVLAYLGCKRVAGFDHGDHSVVIGEVAQLDLRSQEPLVYFRREMGWRITRPRAGRVA